MTRGQASIIRISAIALTVVLSAGAWVFEQQLGEIGGLILLGYILAIVAAFWTAVILTLKLRSPTSFLEVIDG